jgi:hypothetical protein
MTVGQFVEESLMRRLTDSTKDVERPSDHEFHHIMSQLGAMIDKFTYRTNLPGLSNEDLKSLYAMKVHQVLRRGKYDRTKNPRVFFYLVFNNLNRDINRLINTAQKQEMEEDGFEYSFSVDTITQEIYAPELEKHRLDVIMERLTDHHRKIIDITLKNLELDNPVLVPIAKDILDFWL